MKKEVIINIKCPECSSLLNIEEKGKKEAAKFLYKKGYGIRSIQRILGYKSPSTITYLIKKI